MKKIIFILTIAIMASACNKLNISPVSILQDDQVFSSAGGIQAYFAGVYRNLPIEDTKFGQTEGYNQSAFIDNINVYTGELANKNVSNFQNQVVNGSFHQWSDMYAVIRQANYMIQTLPKYASNFTTAQVNMWTGEALFIRAFTYFEMVKRWGGVPLVTTVLNYPEQSFAQLSLPRNSEQEVYDQIGADCDKAASLLGATSENIGRANKYVALALKSRAMLFAGSIAKYNTKNTADPATGKRVQGVPSTEATRYFQASYDASVAVAAGGYTLYRATPNDKVGNYYNLFFDESGANKETIFVREYSDKNASSDYDVYAVPHQVQGPPGYSSYLDATEDFVELFDGLPKNADGTLQTTNANGTYIQYGVTPTLPQAPLSTMNTPSYNAATGANIMTDWTTPTTNNVITNEYGIFANAEPRLLASVVVPGSTFKGEVIDIRRGVYVGAVGAGISSAQFPQTSFNPYANNANVIPCTAQDGPPVVDISNPAINVPAGTKMNSGGLSGIYGSRNGGTITGYLIRKHVNNQLPIALTIQPGSNQPWQEIRYAEVLLNRAEAAWELNAAGASGTNWYQDAYTCINDIRDRAGAILLTSPGQLADVNVIRTERRKELFGENKIYWDLIRWRTFDTYVNNKQWAVLNPFYVKETGKYIYDRRLYEGNTKFTFPIAQYYIQIPAYEIEKDPKLYPNQ